MSQTLIGGESADDVRPLHLRQDLHKDVKYSDAVHKIWSVFTRDNMGCINIDGYLEGLSRICKVLMPHLPKEQVRSLSINDWMNDVSQFSTNGITLDFDAFCKSIAELTDLWCPVNDKDEYAAFLESLFKRCTARVVYSQDGNVVRRDLAKIQYIFVEDEPTTGREVSVEAEKSQQESEELKAATKIQALRRGKTGRKVAKEKKFAKMKKELNPEGLDLRRPKTKTRTLAASKMQAIARGRKGREKARKNQRQSEAEQQHSAAVRMQAVSRGRMARERAKQKKIQARFAQMIPPGLDLRRPGKRRAEKIRQRQLVEKQQQEAAAISMQKVQRAHVAKKVVAEKRRESNAAVSMQKMQRSRAAKKHVAKLRDERENERQAALLRQSSQQEMDYAMSSAIGVWHENVDYYVAEDTSTNDLLVTFEWATIEEIEKIMNQGIAARPTSLLPGHTISPFWETPSADSFATHSHPLIQDRNHAHLRALGTESFQKSAVSNSLTKGENTRLRFQAIARVVGKLSSLKQYALERHVLLYGSSTKNSSVDNSAKGTTELAASGKVLPEAAPLPNSKRSKPPSLDEFGARNTVGKDSALKSSKRDPYGDDDLDQARAVRCNDGTSTTGVQRGVWVLGDTSQDMNLSEKVCARLARDLSLNLVTPKTVLGKAVQDALAFQKVKREIEESNASISSEQEEGAEPSSSPSPIPSPSLSERIGMTLIAGDSVKEEDLDTLLLERLTSAASPGGKGYALTGYPRNKEQALKLNRLSVFKSMEELGGTSGFAPKWIIKLDPGASSDIGLRLKGYVVDLATGNSSTQAERAARIRLAQEEYDNLLTTARNEALAAARENLGEDDKPIPDDISNEELDIDLDALELPAIPKEEELRGSVPVFIPNNVNEGIVKNLRQNYIEPLGCFEHELPRSRVVHVDSTQPIFDDIIKVLIFKLVGTKTVGTPFGRDIAPLIPLSFPELPEELRTVYPEPPADENEEQGLESQEAEQGDIADGVSGEGDEIKATEPDKPSDTESKNEANPEKLNPPLTLAQRQYLLFGEIEKVEDLASEERENEDSNMAPLLEGVGKFLPVNAGAEMGGSLLPPPRRWSYFRDYCPVTLCEKGLLRAGACEHAVMLGGKVYVMKDAESKAKFMATPQLYICERPNVPKSRKVCVIGASYANDATKQCSKLISEIYGLAHICASDILSKCQDMVKRPEGVSPEVFVDKMLDACTSLEGSGGEGGWIMEGCPLNSHHLSLLLASDKWKPDVVAIFAPPNKYADQNAFEDARSKKKLNEKFNYESITIDLTQSFKTYAEQHTLMLSALHDAAASRGMEIYERPSCIEDESTSNTSWDPGESWGNADLIAMVGWMEQSINPFSMRVDPESDISPLGGGGGPTEDKSEMIVQCSNAGVLCPVALSQGTLARGKPELYTIIDGATYTFCDEQAKAKFDACPGEFDGEGDDVGYYLPPPMRLLIIGQRGTDRSKLVEKLAESLGVVHTSIKDDFIYCQEMASLKKSGGSGKNVEEEETENDDVDSDATLPPPETYIFPILERIFNESNTLTKGCVVDGDLDVFTPEVVQGMLQRRMHPTAVLHVTIDNSLAAERRLPEEFSWAPPAPEPPVLNEDGEIDEEADQPEQLTEEQLQEMKEEARSGVLAHLTEEGEATLLQCTSIIDVVTEGNVDVLPPVSVGVSFPLALRRLVAATKRHRQNLMSCAVKYQAVQLGPQIDDDMDEDSVLAAKAEASAIAARLLTSGYKDMSRFQSRCPVDIKESKNTLQRVEDFGFPVIYRHHIYFCSSQANRNKFCAAPTEYLEASAGETPCVEVPPTCCIVGPPLSGKSTLAKILANETGAVLLTPGSVIEWAMLAENKACLSCASKVSEKLLSGLSIQSPKEYRIKPNDSESSALLLQILKARIARADCQIYGWILDGFPETPSAAAELVAVDLAPGIVFCLEGLSNAQIMSRQRSAYALMMNSSLLKDSNLSQDVHSSAVLGRLQQWRRSSESMKAILSQAYLNIEQIKVVNGNGGAHTEWQILASARKALSRSVSRRSAHASALAQHQPAPLKGVPLLASKLKERRGHFGGYCPTSWVLNKRLISIPHGSFAQRAYGVEFNGRVYSCANKKRLEQFMSNTWKILNGSGNELPKDLPLEISLGSHLRSTSTEFAFDGYCPVTFAEGNGSRDWSSIVEGDPLHAVKYCDQLFAFANASQKHKFMLNPSAYTSYKLPLKLPPKMKPLSLEQLKKGGLHGVLAVMEQSLSVATQDALLALGKARLKFPSLSVTETASKFVALYLKAQNPNSNEDVRKRYSERLDAFVSECSLADYLKENAAVMASTPRGSGIKAVRGLSDKKDDARKAYLQKASRFEMLSGEGQESLEQRFFNS